MGWVEDTITAFLKFFAGEGRTAIHEWRQKRRLRVMLKDRRFLKGFRSTEQLMKGIAADRATTERLLLAIEAKRSEVSDEWTLTLPPSRTAT
jgi:hypothetical protein